MHINTVTLDIRDVTSYGPTHMTKAKALKTGGKTEPDKFVRMLEALIDTCLTEWDVLGYGFNLTDSGRKDC